MAADYEHDAPIEEMFSRMSMSEKREKLKALVNSRLHMKKNKKRKNRKQYNNVDINEIFGNKIIKRKRLNEHVNKKSIKKVGRKLKLKQVVGLIERESGSCSIHNNTRVVLDSEGICGGNQESVNEPFRISSTDDVACETLLEKGEPVEIDYGLRRLCAICRIGEDLLLCPQRGWLCGSCIKKKTESCTCDLSELPFEVSSETRNHILPYVNKLRDYWHRGHNAIFFDCQDRLRKVVFFILSLLDNVKKPILIIAANNALSPWEDEFQKWNKLTTFVTYKGSNDARAHIRANEFYSENGSVKFQVLSSSREDIAEDLEMVNQIKWGLIVIDRCQSPKISTHYKKLKMLEADMKLLTLTSEIADYESILSLLDPKFEEIDTDVNMETSDNTTRKLKEKLSPFIAFEYNYTREFKEYWVPVHLSQMQIKQYCSLLDSNMEVLSSCLWDSSPLHAILTQTQKCCDHPYLVDPTLRNSSKKDAAVDTLGAEINVSGKLQLLDKFLLEIERRELKVLILYQPVANSEKISIGDILDDLVDRRFGQDFYVRIPEKITCNSIRKKKKQALEDFNNLQSTKFICLLDYHSCHSSICLSNVDVVILFNSNWNPLNDIRALQKITYECGPVRVFRLYSAFTLEEKALIISKEGTILDVNDYNVNSTVFQQLLAWRVSYLFGKLESETEDSEASSLFINNLVGELSSLLRKKSGGPTSCSHISKAELKDGSYCRSILLLGEMENKSSSIEDELINDEPMTFWTNLMTDNHQKQKNSSNRLSRRVQNSTKNSGFWYEDDEIFSVMIKRKPRSKRKVCDENKKRKFPGWCAQHIGGHRSSERKVCNKTKQRKLSGWRAQRIGGHRSSKRLPTPSQNNQHVCTSSPKPLGTELERIRKEQDDITKLHQEKKSHLLTECEKEILEIRKTYDAMIEEFETSSMNEMKIVEDYYKLVCANNILAELLARYCDDPPNTRLLKEKNKETGTLQIPDISASAYARPVNPCSTSGPNTTFSRSSPCKSGVRAPAPHLMANRSLFASNSSIQTTPKPSVLESFNSSTLVPPVNPSEPIYNQRSHLCFSEQISSGLEERVPAPNLTMPDPFFIDPFPNLSTSPKTPLKKEDLARST
ncbi:uncharacterized protein [Rutidosis leptorrhynchoides]|uniref:uncharacterized protein n=1 Tax=Rutidosis leptorrhynchoides TaxID=125765 RepID=UPI003A9A0F31